MSSTKFVVIVPDAVRQEVLDSVYQMRADVKAAGLGHVYIQMDTDQPDVVDPLARRPRAARSVPISVATPAPVSRATVVYRPLAGVNPDAASPTPRRILMYLLQHPGQTARSIMEWVAGQDASTVEKVQKSVESSLHSLRSKGLIESIEA